MPVNSTSRSTTTTRVSRNTSTATRVGRGQRSSKLHSVVKSINIQRFKAKGRTTFCNQAVHAMASKLGYKGFKGLVANQMMKKMQKAGSGFKQISAQEAIRLAKQGKMVVAALYNNKPRANRPDGKAPGHIALVTGEYSPGVPGIAQAGRKTFEWGPVNQGFGRAQPTYFVKL
jgi:hypothetical protein